LYPLLLQFQSPCLYDALNLFAVLFYILMCLVVNIFFIF
jgi:hypothetical protein